MINYTLFQTDHLRYLVNICFLQLNNYRALTIGTGMAKILDIIVLNQQKEKLSTSDLQFGFKEKLSTTMCSFMVLETIAYYKSKGSNVHVLLLDASKAFDRVDYIKLFEKLVNKGRYVSTNYKTFAEHVYTSKTAS